MSNDKYNNDIKTINAYSIKPSEQSKFVNLKLNDEFAILWNASANFKTKINDKKFEISKDSITLLNDIVDVELEVLSEIKVLKIHKDLLFIDKPQKQISHYSMLFYSSTYLTTFQLSSNKVEDMHFKKTWDLLIYFTKNNLVNYELIVNNLFDYILLLSTNKAIVQKEWNFNNEFGIETLRRFHILVEENFKQITDVKSYANLLNVTPKTLYNISIRNNISPPSQKIKNRRLILIKQLLETTEKSLKEIAEELNFCDIHSLSRFFKTETKVSPSSYRKLTQKGKINKF